FETISGAAYRAVRHFDRCNCETGVDFHQFQRLQFNDGWIAIFARKDIAEALAQAACGFRAGKSGDRRLSPEPQRPQIIYAMAMIGMVMRPEYGVEPIYAVIEQL